MATDTPAESILVDRLRCDELESIASEIDAGRRDHILKSLDERGRAQELVRQQYSGRYPFELLQNANDAAADAGAAGRARFVLTDDALVVADDGTGFGEDQIRAICGLGRSSKDPRKSIGYKGLGFKSVGEITSRPQIFSNATAFEFDDDRVRTVVSEVAGLLEPGQRLPVYAFPFGVDDQSLGRDAGLVAAARADGFTTVLRLPLRTDVSRDDVEKHLVESLVPRLLLFLTGIGELELRGTRADFVAVISRDALNDHDEVLLETNGAIEHWLVYRRWHEVNPELVKPIGDAWAQIERVQTAVAVPLDHGGKPSTESLFPLHVYFPTEEATGLPVIVHGDFVLQLDRRQLGTSPEASPYNDWLLDSVARFVGNEVAPSLAALYPKDIAALGAFTPRSPATGMGQRCIERCIFHLRTSRFLPTIDGTPRVPAEALLLPAGVANANRVHGHLELSDFGRLVIPAAEADSRIRSFLEDQLEVDEWSLEETLENLREPSPSGRVDFYEMLVEWADNYGIRAFSAELATVPCVYTASGDWVVPAAGRVFFPRQREDVQIPADLPVPIADVPEVDGLAELLAAAGVREFEWRELLRDYLLPLLISPDTDAIMRDRAMSGLQAYYASQRTGDPLLQRRIREVLLPATTADGGQKDLRPAGTLYFNEAWTRSHAIETLYGPFGEVEFLALEVPGDSDERAASMIFFSWMGVADHPRVLEARAEQRDTFMTGSVHRHPHRSTEAWQDWWASPDVYTARHCPQEHPESQQLRTSFVLDRFSELVRSGDDVRLFSLWTELARSWGAVYEPATRTTFHCQHTSHGSGGDRDRTAASLLWFQLEQSSWLPTRKGDEVLQVRPSQAWRMAIDTPKWVAKRVPLIDARMLDGAGLGLAIALHVADAARPEPTDLCALLDDLRVEYETAGEATRELHIAARWAMRTLNDVLGDRTEQPDLGEVPLLARFRGERLFTSRPVVAIDPLLAETWEGHYPILDADRDLRRLHEALDLTVLDDPDRGVRITPIPEGVRDDLQQTAERLIVSAKPYLAAIAIANTPSRENDVLNGLRRLEVTACSQLILRYSFEGTTIDRKEATSYIAVRQEAVRGAVRRNIGTALLEVLPNTGEPDWYSFGPQLAQFLQVPTLGDAFAVLLTGTGADRERYLGSRRLPPGAVEEMRLALDLPVEDELSDDLFEFLGDDISSDESGAGTTPDESTDAPDLAAPDRESEQSEDEPLLPIDPALVTMIDVDASEVTTRQRPGGGGGGLGPAGPVDHERGDRRQRQTGRRGEIAAVAAERRRVEAVGMDPSAVVWRSERNPFAPHDIESIDTDGQRIYIEVKATDGDDPEEDFVISQSELLQALRHRSRFYIYRVTRARTESPVVNRYQDPAKLLVEGRASLRLADARMRLGHDLRTE